MRLQGMCGECVGNVKCAGMFLRGKGIICREPNGGRVCEGGEERKEEGNAWGMYNVWGMPLRGKGMRLQGTQLRWTSRTIPG